MALDAGDELRGTGAGALKRDDLGEPLDGVHRVRVHVAERLAGPRPQHVDAVAGEERTQRHHREERDERQRHRPPEPPERPEDHGRDEHRDEERRHGVGEEVLHELDVVGRHPHQVAGAPAHEIGRREPVELPVQRDAHLGQHAERHVVREPRLQPVQHPRQRRDDRQHDQVLGIRLALLDRGHRQRARDPHPDQRRDPHDPEHEHDRELHLPGHHVAQQLAERAGPAQALGAEYCVGRLVVRARVVGLQILQGNLPLVHPLRGRRLKRCVGLRALLGLGAHQPQVHASRAHQRRVIAGLDDGPVVEHEDAVRPDHAGKPVREDESGTPLHQPVERALDDRLILRVDRGERLVQDQDRGITQQRTGDRDALALPSGEPDAPLADDRVVALRQP